MKPRSILQPMVALMLILAFLGGCATPTPSAASQASVTDLLGRQVLVPSTVDRVIAIGPGALRLYVYAGSLDKVVGIEEMDTSDSIGRPYLIANPSLAELPIIGQGGPNNAPDPEKILSVKPDVIFSTYASDATMADELQSKTGIPVIVISYGKTALFDPAVNESLLLIGQVTGQAEKAQAAVDLLADYQQDLAGRTKDIPDAEKPSVYVGGLGSKGTHGIESTQGNYALLNAIQARNVVDETEKTGSVMIDREKLIDWDPDFIFIDQNGYASVMEDYQQNPSFYASLTAMKSGRVYAQLPYNYYSANLDTAIADCYYLGKIIYPDAFADVDPEEKADEIYQALLGKAVYAQMAEDFGGFKLLTFAE
ncbi:MAG: iron ABC transporter substrate-binding protein [Chloroflexi bacterium]|nr:iron ABC transporter substrate-binding protein [Chloroflexota bacterium]